MPLSLLLALAGTAPFILQTAQQEDYRVYTEPPRLLLTQRRLRLLKRERERQSIRWQQLEALVAGKAEMPEPGFGLALYYRVTGESSYGEKAIEWALSSASPKDINDLRQMALVFDWCQPVLADARATALAEKLGQGIAALEASTDVPAVRSRTFAAIALADRQPELTERILSNVIQKWWRVKIAPALQTGRYVIPREEHYALFELLHAVRDNLQIELRSQAPEYFKELPAYRLLTYYPSPYPAPENDYRIPVFRGSGQPDLRQAALSRAADFAVVAYDNNALESQFLQGWLIHDKFLLRGSFGIFYEYLWANPYQPGLSYYHMPLFFHDPSGGRLFVRSSWDNDARWVGCFDGELQVFEDGKIRVLNPASGGEPIPVGETTVLFGRSPMRFAMNLQPAGKYFIVGLKPSHKYDVEADDEEMREEQADAGGILGLEFPADSRGGVRIREAGTPLETSQ